MIEAFYWAVNMSAAAMVAAVCVALVGCIRQIPRRIVDGLWLIPLLRLLIPVAPSSPVSLMGLLARTVPLTNAPESIVMMNFARQADAYRPLTLPTSVTHIWHVASWVWLIGAALLLTGFAASYLRTMRQVRKSVPAGKGMFISQTLPGPAVYGIFRPRIIVGQQMPEEPLVIAHERMHIRRLDNLRRVVLMAAACMHWFNPFVWWMVKKSLNAMEQACDEAVLRRASSEERTRYARALVDAARVKSPAASPFAGGIAGRVQRIVTYRRLSLAAAAMWGVSALALAATLLTNGGVP